VNSDSTTNSDGLTHPEITRIVNRYIGVSNGYLGDFSYRTHADFYPEFCDLDLDLSDYDGTTRDRFIKILKTRPPAEQARIIRGVVERFPLDVQHGPESRTKDLQNELLRLAQRLEGTAVPLGAPAITSVVVTRAIADAEALLKSSGPTSAVDRIHTVLHGFLIAACSEAGIAHASDATMPALLKLLRAEHPKFQDLGPRADDIVRVLNSIGSIMDAFNPVRNRASVAHPNAILLDEAEATLVINAARTVLAYLDAKLR
jgi:hypothetical protein